jgi:hypothetical protein
MNPDSAVSDSQRPSTTVGDSSHASVRKGSDSEHRITARTVRTADGVVATEYRVDGAVVGSLAEVEALLDVAQ